MQTWCVTIKFLVILFPLGMCIITTCNGNTCDEIIRMPWIHQKSANQQISNQGSNSCQILF